MFAMVWAAAWYPLLSTQSCNPPLIWSTRDGCQWVAAPVFCKGAFGSDGPRRRGQESVDPRHGEPAGPTNQPRQRVTGPTESARSHKPLPGLAQAVFRHQAQTGFRPKARTGFGPKPKPAFDQKPDAVLDQKPEPVWAESPNGKKQKPQPVFGPKPKSVLAQTPNRFWAKTPNRFWCKSPTCKWTSG